MPAKPSKPKTKRRTRELGSKDEAEALDCEVFNTRQNSKQKTHSRTPRKKCPGHMSTHEQAEQTKAEQNRTDRKLWRKMSLLQRQQQNEQGTLKQLGQSIVGDVRWDVIEHGRQSGGMRGGEIYVVNERKKKKQEKRKQKMLSIFVVNGIINRIFNLEHCTGAEINWMRKRKHQGELE